jgi:hypothetical protein
MGGFMKKTVITAAAVLVLLITGCGGPSLTREQVDEAFILSSEIYLTASLGALFGMASEGVTFDESAQTLFLDNVSISDLEMESSYKTVSGTFIMNGDVVIADLILTGGPVHTLTYRFSSSEDSSDFVFKVNGEDYTLK